MEKLQVEDYIGPAKMNWCGVQGDHYLRLYRSEQLLARDR